MFCSSVPGRRGLACADLICSPCSWLLLFGGETRNRFRCVFLSLDSMYRTNADERRDRSSIFDKFPRSGSRHSPLPSNLAPQRTPHDIMCTRGRLCVGVFWGLENSWVPRTSSWGSSSPRRRRCSPLSEFVFRCARDTAKPSTSCVCCYLLLLYFGLSVSVSLYFVV